MDETTSKEKVLKKVRHALLYKTPNPVKDLDRESSIYQNIQEGLDINFALEFKNAGGIFIYCENNNELMLALKSLCEERKWTNIYCEDPDIQYIVRQSGMQYNSKPSLAKEMKVGINSCEFLVSRLGSILVSSKNSRANFSCPETNVIIAYTHQLRYDIDDALQAVQLKYGKKMPSMLTFITGPARTFAIEQREVKAGVGAQELFLILVDKL